MGCGHLETQSGAPGRVCYTRLSLRACFLCSVGISLAGMGPLYRLRTRAFVIHRNSGQIVSARPCLGYKFMKRLSMVPRELTESCKCCLLNRKVTRLRDVKNSVGHF
ncbi:hypothetical protein F5883DRAFT_477194 [Diaporthe sp. PMI_573]|nr:hypothetical protein F5883DRAFT_477194 [Diaporthaceae sp. PMI_573]